MSRFANSQNLLKHAKDFIDRRMSLLKNDVNHCSNSDDDDHEHSDDGSNVKKDKTPFV